MAAAMPALGRLLLREGSKTARRSASAWAIPMTSKGVRKLYSNFYYSFTFYDAPLEAFLSEYSRTFFDDTVTRDDPTVSRLRADILAGKRAALASAITLVESTHPRKRAMGNVLLQEMLHEERRRFEAKGRDSLIFRIAISGSPGVGKSSFIEALGEELTERRGKKVAVLTIDPTSQVTGGSILGDLTRMQNLSRNPRAYIRQSPSCGALGGVTRGIHEAVILCEGAGYDVVIIETVGGKLL